MLHRRFTPWLFAALALTSIGHEAALAQSKTDLNGDPLPAGALARLGTLRWRHGSTTSFVAYAADNTLLTATTNGVAQLWDRETGMEIRRFKVNAPGPAALPAFPGVGIMNLNTGRRITVLAEDGKIIATVLANNEVQLWNATTGAAIRKLPAPPTGITTLAFSPDGKSIAMRGSDRSVSIVKTGTGKELSRIKVKPFNPGGRAILIQGGTSGEASGMVFSRDGKVLATSEMDFKMQKYASYVLFSDVKTGDEIRRVDTPDGTSAIAYSPDGKLFAFASANAVYLHDANDGTEIRKITTPAPNSTLVFSPDGKTLAAKGRDQVVRLFNPETGDKMRELGAPVNTNNGALGFFAGVITNETHDLAFSPDGKTIAAAAGPTLNFWDVTTGKEQPGVVGHRGAVSLVLHAADGKTVLTHGVDRTIRRWDAASGKELGQFAEPRNTTTVAFAPDGHTVALANADGTIRLHAAVDGKELHKVKAHQNGAAALAFSADCKWLASRGAGDRFVRLYDVAKGIEVGQMMFHAPKQPGGAVNNGPAVAGQGLAFSRDGKRLAANATSQQVFQNPNQPATVRVASTLHLWDVAACKEIRQIPLPAGRTVTHVAFSPDGRVLACENTDQTISLCEIASGKIRAVLGQATASAQPAPAMGGFIVVNGRGPIRAARGSASVAFAPDGGLLVARGPGNSVRVWDLDSTIEVGRLTGHGGDLQSIAIAADGKSLVSGSADTTALVWDLTRIKRKPRTPAAALSPEAIASLWADLIGDDAGQASRSVLTLAAASMQSVPFLSEQLKPAAPVDAGKLAGWVNDLNSNRFQTRSQATGELEKLGELAVPALQKALDANLPLETRRRIEPLVEKLSTAALSAEQVRIVRAMQVLERIGNPETRALLEALAHGAAGALTTREAQAALTNLARQAAARR